MKQFLLVKKNSPNDLIFKLFSYNIQEYSQEQMAQSEEKWKYRMNGLWY